MVAAREKEERKGEGGREGLPDRSRLTAAAPRLLTQKGERCPPLAPSWEWAGAGLSRVQ